MNFGRWCLDGDVLKSEARDELHFLPSDLEQLFVDEYEMYSQDLSYMYFGTEEGVIFNIPSVFNNKTFDNRFR